MTLGGALFSYFLFPAALTTGTPRSAEKGTGTVTRDYRTVASSKSMEMSPTEFPIFSPF